MGIKIIFCSIIASQRARCLVIGTGGEARRISDAWITRCSRHVDLTPEISPRAAGSLSISTVNLPGRSTWTPEWGRRVCIQRLRRRRLLRGGGRSACRGSPSRRRRATAGPVQMT